MQQPTRNFNSPNYRYGFQGQEKDSELKGEGNSINYKYRMHDPRIGRFFAVDPLAPEYAWNSTYAFSANRLIDAVELEGLEAKHFTVRNVTFVTLKNVDFKIVLRGSRETMTSALNKNTTPDKDNFSVNLNFFGLVDKSIINHYFHYPWVATPQPLSNYTIEGQTVGEDGKVAFGLPANPDRGYFAKEDGKWKASIGNTPTDNGFGFGGGVPIYIDGMKFGSEEIKDENGKVIQSSARGWSGISGVSDGKTILGYKSSTDEWIVVSQQDNKKGLTLGRIRDLMIEYGADSIIGFDGGSSATLIKNNETIVRPANFKNNQMPTGAILSVPKEKTKNEDNK